jgi:purine-nucleoside phosphorylase
MITDHINLTGASPLIGSAEFLDLTDAYSPRLREKFREAALKIDIVLYEGVYAGSMCPQYETLAEVWMLQNSAPTRSACPPCSKSSKPAPSRSK